MRKPGWGAAVSLLWAGSAIAAPRVAFLYSAWGNYAFREEFDSHLGTLGWPLEKFENRDAAALVSRLAEFDIVISGGVGNYENPVDMAPFRDAWLRFLEGGGLLLITDASYGSVLDLWTNRLGDGFALGTQTCARHTRTGPDPDRQDFHPSDPVLSVPRDLPGVLRERGNLWAHLVPRAPGWRSLITCADGQSFFVYQDVGRGCLAVTSHYSFRGAGHERAAVALLENLWTRVQGLRAGLALTAFEAGPALPGRHEVVLGVRRVQGEALPIEAAIAVTGPGDAEPAAAAGPVTVPAEGDATVRLPYTVTRRGTVRLDIALRAGGKPALAFSRELVVPPLVALRVPERHAYPWHTELSWSGTLAPEAGIPPEELKAELRLDGKPAGAFAAPPAELAGKAALGGLALGEHRLELVLARGAEVLGTAAQTFVTHPLPRVYIRPGDLTAMVDGKPFFPMGFYHVSWGFPAEDRMQFLREVAAAGFNTVHASLKQIDEWDAFLAEAERLNVKVITEFGVDMTAAITRYRGRRAVLAWNPGDEPDGGGVPPEVMLERHNRIKDADPDVPTYMTLCVPSAYAKYAGMAEVIAPDIYPIRYAGASAVPVFTTLTQAVAAAAPLGRPIWFIPQAFGYPREQNSWRVPTFAEVRAMTYLGLLAGAKGLIYYTYRDNGFHMREHPELWEGMKTLPAEIDALAPFLLEGTRELLDTGSKELFAGHWAARGRHAVCVVNASPAEAGEVNLPLPTGAGGAAGDLFPGRPGGLTVREGKLTGRLDPLTVAVCELR